MASFGKKIIFGDHESSRTFKDKKNERKNPRVELEPTDLCAGFSISSPYEISS